MSARGSPEARFPFFGLTWHRWHRRWRRSTLERCDFQKDELCGDDNVDRAIMWKKARVPQDGQIEDTNLERAVQRIDEYIRKKEEGEFKSDRCGEYLLTCALEKREHSGRVRVVGSYVTPSIWFKHPKERRKHMKEEHVVELIEVKKQIAEQNQMICHLHDRISKLKATAAKDKDHEEKGSCSVKQPYHLIDEDVEEENEKIFDDVVLIEKVDALQALLFNLYVL